MAKKKSKPVAIVTADETKGRARQRGDVRLLAVEIDAGLLAAFDAYVNAYKPRTTKRAIAEWAIEDFLTKQKAYPQKP